ncbi:hypothetical protein [Haloprofundus salilacus]|uniref:hypothetical protein n=1 Tax=Haloprofundus salilacus TaxID=2876190 RepID=UPI001CCA4E49|nr:hypothetical protein [Haloprofundus salilacus]
MTPSRRHFLRATGLAAVGLTAGCTALPTESGDDGSSSTTATPTTSPDPSGENSTTPASNAAFTLPESSIRTLGDVQVAVANPTVEKAVAYDSIMGSGGVLAPEDRQFVVAEVQSDDGSGVNAVAEPEYDAFELSAAGTTYSAVKVETRTEGAYTTMLAGRGEIQYDDPYAYPESEQVGWVVFEPPSPLDANDATIRCRRGDDTAEWSLPADAVSELRRRAPTFELQSFETEVINDGTSVELSLVAENVSNVDGEFLAAVYWPTTGIADDDESTVVRDNVDAGGHVEWSQGFSTEYTGGEDGLVTASVDGMVSASETVDLGTASTTETTADSSD